MSKKYLQTSVQSIFNTRRKILFILYFSGHVMFYLLHKHHNESSPGIFIGFYRQLSLKGHSQVIDMHITYQ